MDGGQAELRLDRQNAEMWVVFLLEGDVGDDCEAGVVDGLVATVRWGAQNGGREGRDPD